MNWLKKLIGGQKNESTVEAEALMATSQEGEATILRLDDTGGRVNNDPRLSLLLEIRIPGHLAYQVQKTVAIPII